jgi:outer membrane receptor protein involved in Fe transport
MKSKILTGSIIATYALLNTPAFAEETTTLDPIIVSADFREAKLSETTNSVSVIGEEEIYDKASAAFEEVIGKAPNVNFTSGGSRAHHIQIRGIGERSQFQYPLNPSVGLNIDGMDFSNNALAVTLFDVKQIEVLKGPQGTTFGANGMAGVINVQSNEPTKETEGHIEATIGDYNTKAFGAAVGGTLIEDTLLGRISVYKNTSDGFMENSFLNRDDVNDIDELTTKAQLRWFASDKHTIDLNYMYIDVDNGYDAFTLDNSRTSHSDAGGQDTLKTDAIAIKSTYQINPKMHLVSKLDWSDTDSKYSYDNDWSYAGEIVDGVEQYIGSDSYTRNVKNVAVDARLVSDADGRIFNGTTDWIIGVYYQDKDQSLDRLEKYYEDNYWGPYGESTNLITEYKTKSTALYGQLDTVLSPKLTLVSGLRVENWDAEYSDHQVFTDSYGSLDQTNMNIDHDEVLYGGKLGLNYQLDEKTLLYTSLSRGYKPGGVNIDVDLDPSLKTYETEILWNLEAGVNSSHLDDKLKSRLNLFYAKRKDQQIETSIQDGASFSEYLSNAAKGHNYGLESEIDFYPTDTLHFYSNIGLLQTEFDEYNNPDPDANDLEGREQAQAPNYQFNVGVDYNFASNWTINTNVEGKGDYYFSDSSNEKIDSYHIFNAALGYTGDNWSVNLWVRNIADKDYDVKGYYFDNKIANPNVIGVPTLEADYDENWDQAEVFTQKGAPRTIGFTVAYDF